MSFIFFPTTRVFILGFAMIFSMIMFAVFLLARRPEIRRESDTWSDVCLWIPALISSLCEIYFEAYFNLNKPIPVGIVIELK